MITQHDIDAFSLDDPSDQHAEIVDAVIALCRLAAMASQIDGRARIEDPFGYWELSSYADSDSDCSKPPKTAL